MGREGKDNVQLRNRAAALTLAVCAAALSVLGVQAPPSSESRSVWDGVYTEEQAKRGEPLYRKECASCHGDVLSGGEYAPAPPGGAFLSDLNGLPLGGLFYRIL